MKETIAVIMTNVSGGGTVRHAMEMIRAWSSQGMTVLFVNVTGRLTEISVYQEDRMMKGYRLWGDNEGEELLSILRAYKVKLLHVEHLLDAEPLFLNLHRKLGVPLIVTLHDYYTVCPFIKLTNENDEYCGEEGEAACQACLLRRHFYSHTTCGEVSDISHWRGLWERYLEEAALAIVPSEDTKRRILSYYPHIHIRMIEDPELLGGEGKGRIIGLIGALGTPKGARKVQEVLRAVIARGEDLHFLLFGTLNDVALTEEEKKYITVLGPYEETEIYDLIYQHPVDFFWFPGVWPETYSYTLSIPVRLRIPCVSTDLGAIASRITGSGWGETYPWKSAGPAILDKLMAFDYEAYGNPAFCIRNDSFGKPEDYYGDILLSVDKEREDAAPCPDIQVSDVYEKIHDTLRREEHGPLWQKATLCQRVRLLRYINWDWILTVLHKKGWRHILRKIYEKSFGQGMSVSKIRLKLKKCYKSGGVTLNRDPMQAAWLASGNGTGAYLCW